MYYVISSLINFVTSLSVATLVYLLNRKSVLNRCFIAFSASVAFWAFGYTFWQLSSDHEQALFWIRFAMIGSIFIPPTFTEFAIQLVSTRKKFSLLMKINWLITIGLTIFSYSELFILTVRSIAGFHFWPKPSFLFYIFHVFFAANVIFSCALIFEKWRFSTGLSRVKLGYVLIALLIGFVGGMTNHPLWYDIPIPPIGNITVSIYVLLITYAIAKYRLMDIQLVLTKLTIFILVYTIVLGFPFWLGYKYNLWKYSTWAMFLLATLGPYIYIWLKKSAENQLLQEQRQYQNTLRQASMGIARIKDINRLLNLMVHILSRAVHIEHCSIYLLDGTKGNYVLKASRGSEGRKKGILRELDQDSVLIKRLKDDQEIIVCEEVKQQAIDAGDENSERIISAVQELEAELVVPSLDDENLIAVIVLGRKKSGAMYSSDDLLVFSILANQSAIGIENALFYEETGKNLVEKFHEKRLKFLGELGSGVAHQMNNRFNVMTMASGVGLEEINEKDINTLSKEELIQIINYNKGILEKIENSALKGKEIAEAIKTYSKASVVPSAITLEKSISSSLNLLACKFKIEYLNVKKEYSPDIYVGANLSTLQEDISNAIRSE